jgi:hypothetical protein
MIIKLKNAVEEFKGKIFLLNSDIIATVYEAKDENGADCVFVYSTGDKTWKVQDTVEEIYAQVTQ